MSNTNMTPERFWSKVDIRGPSECWPWKGSLRGEASKGQSRKGEVGCNGKKMMTHRLAFIYAIGPIPDGLQVNHTCDYGVCCNPAHLYIGTQLENMQDMDRRGRRRNAERSGEANPFAKLTVQIVHRIRTKWASGLYTKASLAREEQISRRTIQQVINREAWRHV